MTERLYKNCGISKEFAHWAVESWAFALNKQPQHSKNAAPYKIQTSQKWKSREAQLSKSLDISSRITVQECSLNNLIINNTATGYDALKKRNRNIALCLYVPLENAYLLGIRSTYRDPELTSLLNSCQSLETNCPSEFIPRFSPQGRKDWSHSQYHWFLNVPKPIIIKSFQILDQRF